MSQPRRRRRRRRGRGSGRAAASGASDAHKATPTAEPASSAAGSRRSRRRRGRPRGAARAEPTSPASSEDLVKAPDKPTRSDLVTRPPDDTTLEQVIGDLQSEWGVPQSPQEFRITLKVADDRSNGAGAGNGAAATGQPISAAPAEGAGPKREKAPAAPRIGAQEDAPEGGRRKRRGRRRRRRNASGDG